MNLISVDEATNIVLDNTIEVGQEEIAVEQALGYVLDMPLVADRDFPPFDRVTMDGIAINWSSYNNGLRSFQIESIQTAGDNQLTLSNLQNSIEVMTGSMLPKNTDTVVRYEDITINQQVATINVGVAKGQNIHWQGEDCIKGKTIVEPFTLCNPTHIAIAASVGAATIKIKKLPKVCIITSGDELVKITQQPNVQQIRSSNIYAIAALLKQYKIESSFIHIPDEPSITQIQIENALSEYDVLILCGGVSQGKKDFIPVALNAVGVQKYFHKVAQQPGKPFWFGRRENKIVFALPGNPVSAFLCTRRYFIPWIRKSLGLLPLDYKEIAIASDYYYKNSLTYFLQAQTYYDKATLRARPLTGHGSGDFVNMVSANGFIELPAQQNNFQQGEILKFWQY